MNINDVIIKLYFHIIFNKVPYVNSFSMPCIEQDIIVSQQQNANRKIEKQQIIH